MSTARRGRILVLGMLTRHPVPGMVWLTMQYVEGLRRLGYDSYYVEPHAGDPRTESATTAAWVEQAMRRFGFEDRWAVDARNGDGRCYGRTESELAELYRTADVILNLHGSAKATPELCQTGHLVYVGTDPMVMEVALAEGDPAAGDYLSRHAALFTWGECYGTPTCLVPPDDTFTFLPTRQPVIIDHWLPHRGPDSGTFTTIGNWRQGHRDYDFLGERFTWSKHHEFDKVLALPRRCGEHFELALASYDDADRALLESNGWRVRPAAELATVDSYRDYVTHSLAEFTIAKEQYARLRSGWFSDRSATYLASGRPVVTSETGFSDHLPTGEGLFAFDDLDEAASACDAVLADPERQSAAASQIAREHFGYDVVLTSLLDRIHL